MVTRLQIAKPDIEAHFARGPRVLKDRDILVALDDNRDFWRLAKSTGLKAFIEFLVAKTELRPIRFPFKQRPIEGFTWGRVPMLEALQSLLGGYYSHYTAVQVHGLTEQVPKVVYITTERSSPHLQREDEGDPKEPYAQEAIDAAFSRPQRVSQNVCQAGALKLVHLASAFHASEGVVAQRVNFGDEGAFEMMVTSLERTLIDIAVRPLYAGGVSEVLKAYKMSRDKDLSVNRMGAMLRRMGFGYPYHQAIGFYLERAGFRSTQLDVLRRIPQERDFYLTYEMGQCDYVPQWRLFIPKGL